MDILKGGSQPLSEKPFDERATLFRTILAHAPIVLFAFDTNGIFTLSEGKGLDALGLRQGEVVGRSVFEVYKDFPQILTDARRALSGEGFASTVDVRGLYFEVRYEPLLAVNGTSCGAVGVALNVTESKQTEEALRESESKFRNLSERSLIGIYLIQDGVFKYVNPRFAEIFGYSSEELVDRKGPRDLALPEDWPIAEENIRRRISGQESSIHYTFRGITKNREVLFIEVYGSRTIYHELPAVIGTLLDVTDRIKGMEALRRGESRYRHIFNSAGVSIWEEDFSAVKAALDDLKAAGVVDFRAYLDTHPEFLREAAKMTRVLDVNDATLTLYGAKSKDELLRSPEKVFAQESYAAVAELLIAIASGKTHFEAETMNKTLQGIPLTVLVNISIPSETSEFKHLLVSIVDVTERRRMEEDIKRSQKLESLGILAGGIAHDFNNLLTAILGNVSLVKTLIRPGDKIHKRLEESERAILRAKDLTHQLLTFSKGGTPLKKTTLIPGLLRDSVEFALRGSNVKGEFIIEDDIWPVDVDEGQIVQVFNNLVINACQSMPRGGMLKIKIANVTLDARDGLPIPDGMYVRTSIQDEGIGIPKQYLQKIFDPYFTTKQRGSGLGLAVAHSIVQHHKGFITVDSELEGGSTFTVYLPASRKEIAEKQAAEEGHVPGKGKVLFMDDEEMVRNVARDILETMGYDVVLAKDGAEALDLFRHAKGSSRSFDVVIMDLTVPGGMGGKETVGRLRELDPGIKAIVSSGYSNDPVMANYREYGFDEVIAKPYRSVQLSKVLQRLIGGSEDDSL